jgi:hypothetical protein
MCNKCSAFEGLWQETPRGLTRCDCASGQKLKAAEETRRHPVAQPPLISSNDAEKFAEMLLTLPYSPAGAAARAFIGAEIRCMCKSHEEALWLVRKMIRLYSRWPGAGELRKVFCSRFLPLDGVLDEAPSEIYIDGIPADSDRAPAMGALPPGATPQTGTRSSLRRGPLE